MLIRQNTMNTDGFIKKKCRIVQGILRIRARKLGRLRGVCVHAGYRIYDGDAAFIRIVVVTIWVIVPI
jgi:hypothetical protein